MTLEEEDRSWTWKNLELEEVKRRRPSKGGRKILMEGGGETQRSSII